MDSPGVGHGELTSIVHYLVIYDTQADHRVMKKVDRTITSREVIS